MFLVEMLADMNDFGQSKEECLYLIGLAKPYMEKSTVVDIKTGKNIDSRSVFVIFMFVINRICQS